MTVASSGRKVGELRGTKTSHLYFKGELLLKSSPTINSLKTMKRYINKCRREEIPYYHLFGCIAVANAKIALSGVYWLFIL